MISMTPANHLRDNHEEVMRRWFENRHGHIADDFEQMLRTPMGGGVCNKRRGHAIEFLAVEEYRKGAILHGIRDIASDAAFRRAAVGFGLPDIVTTVLAFRQALEETLLFHAIHSSVESENEIVEGKWP